MTLEHPPMQSHPAADLFPMMPAEELQELADAIAARGLKHPIVRMPDGRILDGRHRFIACHMAGVEPRFVTYQGDDPLQDVLDWNLRTRHLTTGQRAVVATATKEYEARLALERKAAGGREAGRGRPRKDVADLPHPIDEPALIDDPEPAPVAKPKRGKSRDIAGQKHGVSGRSIQKAEQLQKEAPDLYEQVASGELALDRAHRILRDRKAEKARVEQAKRDAEAREHAPNIDLRTGDFRDVLADLDQVDAIITDPPYPREYLPLLDDLAAWADKVLAPDGVLAVLFGQTYLPEVYRRLDGHRPYRWTMAYLTPGAGYTSHVARVQSNWKPVLIYGGGPRFADVLRSEGSDAGAKNLHHWGQDYAAFDTLVKRLTRPGQTVVDPFMGAGTTLLAAHAHGCHVIGADIDPEHVATTQKRFGL